MGAAIASLVTLDTAKFMSSHMGSFCSSRHIVTGSDEVHSSMPVWNSKLNAVQPAGSGMRYHWPLVAVSAISGSMEVMQVGLSLQSK